MNRGDKCLIMTCYDDRIDPLITQLAQYIRIQGGLLDNKDIQRPPGGVYLTAGDRECRPAFYRMITAYYDIAGIRRFFFIPHTNCRLCHRDSHLQQKIGTGTKTDLRFHLNATRKLLSGATEHFNHLSEETRPEFEAGIALTIDQRIVTLDHASEILPSVPAHHEHGQRCFGFNAV